MVWLNFSVDDTRSWCGETVESVITFYGNVQLSLIVDLLYFLLISFRICPKLRQLIGGSWFTSGIKQSGQVRHIQRWKDGRNHRKWTVSMDTGVKYWYHLKPNLTGTLLCLKSSPCVPMSNYILRICNFLNDPIT